ncbi:MAG: site-specific DNA-methyltransferase [Candidatus Thorarchaeota archaeon]|nr:site-specific DNA-methyltransferase [Candidatus Thorarchaeota archaeon]
MFFVDRKYKQIALDVYNVHSTKSRRRKSKKSYLYRRVEKTLKPDFGKAINEYILKGIDKDKINQEDLDLQNGRNHNIFSFKGQFSPDFVRTILSHFAKPGQFIVDPFVGCGTTIFEAARLGLNAVGTDINVGAIEMAQTCQFISMSRTERINEIRRCRNILNEAISSTGTLLSHAHTTQMDKSIERILADLILKHKDNPPIRNILMNSLMLMMRKGDSWGAVDFWSAFERHCTIIRNLPVTQGYFAAYLQDARCLPVRDNTVDLIFTSPPYVNVFNYHQQNRNAIELIGWNVLDLARSEFGANRKNRGNRFRTIVQYILDMGQAMLEMKRVVSDEGRIIIVIGRESRVRGVNLRNDHIIIGIAHCVGLSLALHQERHFKNNYGVEIFEDIIHLTPRKEILPDVYQACRELAKFILKQLRDQAREAGSLDDLEIAISSIESVEPSPLLDNLGEVVIIESNPSMVTR